MNPRHPKSSAALIAAVLAATIALQWPQGVLPAETPIDHSDADHARDEVAAGRFVPLESIIGDAQSRYNGRIVDVELDDDEYEVEILMPDGTKVELEYDPRTGELLDEEVDD